MWIVKKSANKKANCLYGKNIAIALKKSLTFIAILCNKN